MRAIVIGGTLALALLSGRAAFAHLSCDQRMAEAKGKLVALECLAQAHGVLSSVKPSLERKFQKACMKAKTIGGCVMQTESCAAAQSEGETFVTQHCAGSPSAAFLE